MSVSFTQVISTMTIIYIYYKMRLTAKYMLVTPYMTMKIFASVNFLKQKYKPAVTTTSTINCYVISILIPFIHYD